MPARCLHLFLLLAMGCQSHSVLSLGTRPGDTTDDVDTTPAPDTDPMDASGAAPDDVDASAMPSVVPPAPTLVELDASVEPDADPEPVPLHRYSFDGSGTVAVDSATGADGLILGGATLTDTGALELDGVDDYIELPQRLISGLDGVTLMVWAAVHSDVCWQRFFDFGNDVIVDDGVAVGDTALYLSPRGCSTIEGPSAYLQFRRNLGGDMFVQEFLAARTSQFVDDVEHQFVMVVDSQAVLLYLYIDGVEQARRSLVAVDGGVSFGLSDVVDVNCWIGRSQYAADPFLSATMREFRIYDDALGPDSALAAFEAGPDTLP